MAKKKKSTVTGNRAIKDVYDRGMEEVQRVELDINSTAAQRKAAREARKDLTAMLLAHTLKNVEGRTALLSGLIVELTAVIEAVQVKSPLAQAANKLTGVLGTARKLLDKEKKELV